MIETNLGEVAGIVKGKLFGGGEAKIRSASISTASKADLFIAVKGERRDGAIFIPQAMKLGFKAAITQTPDPSCPLPQIVVEDSIAALSSLAKNNLEKRRALGGFREIALTGSVGKTTTKDILSHIFSAFAPTVASEGSFNNELGLPLTCLRVDGETEYLVAEMGANKIGDISRLCSIAPCDVALELRVGFAHEGEFGSRKNIFLAKSELVSSLKPDGVAVLNAQDGMVRDMARLTRAKVAYYSCQFNPSMCACASNLDLDELGRPSFDLFLAGKRAGRVRLSLLGRHNASNALAAAACAKACGLEDGFIAERLSSFSSVSGHRLDLFECKAFGKNCLVLDDTFNANPDSMSNCIAVAERICKKKKKKMVAIISPMLELGEKGEAYHKKVGSGLSRSASKLIVVCGDEKFDPLARAYMENVKGAKLVRSADEARAEAERAVREIQDPLLVLKGSHAFQLERLAQDLKGTGK